MEGSLVMTTEDAAWVARAKAGDQTAFAALFARYERRIYAFVYRMMGDPDDAFDLTQETFIKAYRALDKTDEELNVNAWLHRIASNACMDVLRRRQRIRWLPWEGAKHDRASQIREDDPEGALIGDETQRTVQRVMLGAVLSGPPNRLPPLLLLRTASEAVNRSATRAMAIAP